MPPLSRPLQHGVRKDSLYLPRFFSRTQVQSLFLPRLCFLLFYALYSSPILFFAESLACFLHDTLLPLRLLKWGWKAFGLSRYFVFTAMPSFVAPRYFCLHRDALLLLLHDIYDFTEMPSFVASRYLWLDRDAIFLLLHDISDFTTLLSFVAPRYFWVHRDAIFLMHHDTFFFATTFCRSPKLTTALSCAAISSTVFKNYATLAASRPARC